MIYNIILIISISLLLQSCDNGNKIRLIGSGGSVYSERRIPIQNRKYLGMHEEDTNSPAHYKKEEDGGKYYTTGKAETPIVPKDFATVKNFSHPSNSIPSEAPKTEHQDGAFVPLMDINLNENKNANYTKKIILDRQNITTNTEYNPPKPKHPSTSENNQAKLSNNKTIVKKDNQFENLAKQKNTHEIVTEAASEDDSHNLYFIKVFESESLPDASEQIPIIRKLTQNGISLEKDNETQYKLMVGPIYDKNEASILLAKLRKERYKESVLIKQ